MSSIRLPESDDDLLNECQVYTYKSSGPGGQHVNTTDSAVRLKHIPTGLTVTAQQERSQHLNKLICIKKLREKVDKLNYRKPFRIPTKIPRSAKERIFKSKSKHKEKKQLRSKPNF